MPDCHFSFRLINYLISLVPKHATLISQFKIYHRILLKKIVQLIMFEIIDLNLFKNRSKNGKKQ